MTHDALKFQLTRPLLLNVEKLHCSFTIKIFTETFLFHLRTAQLHNKTAMLKLSMGINEKPVWKSDSVHDSIWLEICKHKESTSNEVIWKKLMLYLFCFFLQVNKRQIFQKVTGLVGTLSVSPSFLFVTQFLRAACNLMDATLLKPCGICVDTSVSLRTINPYLNQAKE